MGFCWQIKQQLCIPTELQCSRAAVGSAGGGCSVPSCSALHRRWIPSPLHRGFPLDPNAPTPPSAFLGSQGFPPSLPPTPRPVCSGASPRPESPHSPAGGGRLTIAHKGRMSPPSLPLGPSSRKAPGGGGPGPTGRTVDGLRPVEAALELRAAPGERVGVPGDGWRKRRRRMCSIVSTFC